MHLRDPGVYVEELEYGTYPVTAAGTSTACLIGEVDSSGDNVLRLINSITDYVAAYGEDALYDAFGMAVQAFFSNGGVSAYTKRMPAGSPVQFSNAFAELRTKGDINILLLPGIALLPPPNSEASDNGSVTAKTIIDAAIEHCTEMQDRMVIVDIAESVEIKADADYEALGLAPSSYAALYYPWMTVANPLYDANEGSSSEPETINVPPSAFAAGIWARTDILHGVWKAPAGTTADITGISGTTVIVGDIVQDILNPLGINAIRTLPRVGKVLWGARTSATRTEPQWRHLPVRRTAIMIKSSIRNGIQSAAFEPNTIALWLALRASIGNFMDTLFRAGALQGTTASDAYFVRCGLGETMTQDDIDTGRVIVEVGFAAAKPAEFVILRIQQMVNQS